MKKLIIYGIIAVSIGLFAVGSYYALFRYRTFPPVAAKSPEVLDVPWVSETVELTIEGAQHPLWERLPGKEIPLLPQVTAVPWGKASIPQVSVKAFHNGQQIFFRFQWRDMTEDRQVGQNTFSDACAIMLPLDENPPPHSLMMGFLNRANIWAWKAVLDTQVWGEAPAPERAYADYYYPYQEQEVFPIAMEPVRSAVQDLMAQGVATVTPKEKQSVSGRGFWRDGQWTVILMRSLAAEDVQSDAPFVPGKPRAAAFAVWDGAKGDRGARKSISEWVRLQLGDKK